MMVSGSIVWRKYCLTFVAQHDGELAMFVVHGMRGDTIVSDCDYDSGSSTSDDSEISLNHARGLAIVDVHC